MFSNIPKMEKEDLINMMAGFLPDAKHILTITPATVWYAKFKDKQEKVSYIPLIGWAYLKNGAMLPLLYKHSDRCHFIAFAVDGFMGVIHDDDVPDDDNDGINEFKSK
jgi:hypothetical protein